MHREVHFDVFIECVAYTVPEVCDDQEKGETICLRLIYD